MKESSIWTMLTMLLATQTVSLAQQPYKLKKPEGEAFVKAAPTLGDLFPDLVVYDTEGNQVPTRNLRGHYTVLVFGCLT